MLNQDSYKQHISEQFNAELDGVKSRMLVMGGLVEQQIIAGVAAMVDSDTGAAAEVVRDHLPQDGVPTLQQGCHGLT